MSSSGERESVTDTQMPLLDLPSSSRRSKKRTEAGPSDSDVQTVFAAWVEATGKSRSVLDAKRRLKIRTALAMFPLAEVVDAVRGWSNDPFYCGQNDRNTVYNDLGLLLRDAAHIEKFRDMANAPVVRHRSNGNGDLWARVASGEMV